jgi:iron-sulfur cluster assembly protein
MFNVTTAAAREILAAAERSGAEGMALRVAARNRPDGRIEYGMGFDDEREDDEPARFDTLMILVGAPSRALLSGTVLDFVEVEPGRFDFVFAPAHESATAGHDPASGAARGGCGNGGGGSCSA